MKAKDKKHPHHWKGKETKKQRHAIDNTPRKLTFSATTPFNKQKSEQYST